MEIFCFGPKMMSSDFKIFGIIIILLDKIITGLNVSKVKPHTHICHSDTISHTKQKKCVQLKKLKTLKINCDIMIKF